MTFNNNWKNPNKQRLKFFTKARSGRYARAIEDDPFAVKLYEKQVEERRKRWTVTIHKHD